MTLLRSSLSTLAIAGSALALLIHCAPAAPDAPAPLGSTTSTGGADGSPGYGEDATSPGTGTPAGDVAVASDGGPQGSEDSSSGSDGGSGVDANPSVDCPARTLYPQTSFVSMAVAPGQALTPGQSDAVPGDAGVATPAGWDFHQGGTCRDGSPAGFFVHYSTSGSDKLFIYLEGGGACDSATFCSHNPGNIQTVFAGGAASQGQTIGGSLGFASTGQVPYTATPAQDLTAWPYSPRHLRLPQRRQPVQGLERRLRPLLHRRRATSGRRTTSTSPVTACCPRRPHQHYRRAPELPVVHRACRADLPNVSQVLLTGASAGRRTPRL